MNEVNNNPLNELATALAKAQSEIKPAEKDGKNPHFKSQYSTLEAIWSAARGPLTRNGLSVVQTTKVGTNGGIVLVTTLLHSSGQSISGELPLLLGDKATSQGLGSCLTYSKRYGIAAMVGICSGEDDDGNAASTPVSGNGYSAAKLLVPPPQADYPKASANWREELATEPQRKRLWALAKEAAYDETTLRDLIYNTFDKESTKDLTKGEIQDLFKVLEADIAK